MEPTRISAEEAASRLERGENLVFVDTRSDNDWQQSSSQIPGSVRSEATQITQHLGQIPSGRTVVTYCD